LFPSFVVDDVDVTPLKYKMLSRAIDQLNALRDLRTKKEARNDILCGENVVMVCYLLCDLRRDEFFRLR
jgi:hypothetical protein